MYIQTKILVEVHMRCSHLVLKASTVAAHHLLTQEKTVDAAHGITVCYPVESCTLHGTQAIQKT